MASSEGNDDESLEMAPVWTPFSVLNDWPDDDPLDLLFPMPLHDRDLPESGLSRIWFRAQQRAERMSRPVMRVLQLLTCNLMSYWFEILSLRNILYLAMSAMMFVTLWMSLEPSSVGWAFGLLYLFVASMRIGVVEPAWSVAILLTAQVVFDSLEDAREGLWQVLAVVAVLSEAFWWPSCAFLIEASFHTWLIHFSSYYAVMIELWLWPQIMLVDPSQWAFARELMKSSTEQTAVLQASVSLGVLVGIPILAATVLGVLILWRKSPKLCLAISAAYVCIVLVLLALQNATPQQATVVGQLFLAFILVLVTRDQMGSVFGDHDSWRTQAAFLGLVLALWLMAGLLPHPNQTRVAEVLFLQLGFKCWLDIQCCRVLSQETSSAIGAWLPRRSFLLGRQEAYQHRLVLER